MEKLIFDNRSSRKLYECYEIAFDFYFHHYNKDAVWQELIINNFHLIMTTNQEGDIIIKIYDDNGEDQNLKNV